MNNPLFHPTDFPPITQRTLGGKHGLHTHVINNTATIRHLIEHNYLGKDLRLWEAIQRGQTPPRHGLIGIAQMRSMLNTDGDSHRRQRAPANRSFSARRIEALGPRIAEITRDLLDDLATHPPDQDIDLRERFATPLPLQVFCELLGINDPAHRQALTDHGHTLLNTASTPAQVDTARAGIDTVLARLVEDKANHPGNDLATDLVAAHCDYETLSRPELLANLMILYIAGHATVANLLTNANYGLLTNPSQLQLVADRKATWDDVFEEACRCYGAVSVAWGYYMRRDYQAGDVFLPRGASVSFGLEAIGRDARIHGPDAGDFRVLRRTRRDHMAFGIGPHHCVGRALARLEVVIALRGLYRRFPRMVLAPGPGPSRTGEETMVALDGLRVRLGRPRYALGLGCGCPGMRERPRRPVWPRGRWRAQVCGVRRPGRVRRRGACLRPPACRWCAPRRSAGRVRGWCRWPCRRRRGWRLRRASPGRLPGGPAVARR